MVELASMNEISFRSLLICMLITQIDIVNAEEMCKTSNPIVLSSFACYDVTDQVTGCRDKVLGHCFFELAPDQNVVWKKGPYKAISISNARDECKKYNAGLLQLRTDDLQYFFNHNVNKLYAKGQQGFMMRFPLGIKEWVKYTVDEDSFVNITWDNGDVVRLRESQVHIGKNDNPNTHIGCSQTMYRSVPVFERADRIAHPIKLICHQEPSSPAVSTDKATDDSLGSISSDVPATATDDTTNPQKPATDQTNIYATNSTVMQPTSGYSGKDGDWQCLMFLAGTVIAIMIDG